MKLSAVYAPFKWLSKQLAKLKPSKNAVNGASFTLAISASVLFLIYALSLTRSFNDPWVLTFFVGIAILFLLGAYLTVWVLGKLHAIPRLLKRTLLFAIPLLFFVFAFEPMYVLGTVLIAILLGGATNVVLKGDFITLNWPKKGLVIVSFCLSLGAIVAGVMAYIQAGFDTPPRINAAALNASDIANIQADSPALNGQYSVNTLTYGSGKDKHRTEFSDQVTLTSPTVNGVALLDNWQGFNGWYREQYWGFDDKQLPLNAYVWYPQGEGPFPLVLMVHGNHAMQDYSDDGYAYLGELLASRGFIFASVDQNFINFSWSDIGGGLEEENDARGWLLLEHLKLWHKWNDDTQHTFYNKIDTQNIALMGHSRGGEAVAHAALLNKMPAYYDDATVAFDYNFNIQSIVAIAPVDGQYKPGDNLTSLKDINYFVLHGAQDADVSSFAGAKQYQRVTFSKDTEYFKSSLYIEGANHGQFNTGWGDNDSSASSVQFLNNSALMAAQDQQTIAQVYISAFLQTTLKNDSTFKPLFIDHRKGKDWLPDTVYLNQFEDASFVPIASFDEDFNVATGTIENSTISTEGLSIWREQEIQLKWGTKGTRAAVIGWHNEEEAEAEAEPISITPSLETLSVDTTSSDSLSSLPNRASFTITFGPTETMTSTNSMLVLSLAESTEASNPKASGKWVETANNLSSDTNSKANKNAPNDDQPSKLGNSTNKTSNDGNKEQDDKDEPKPPLDFTIELRDATGKTATFPLSQFSALQREIQVRLSKAQVMKGSSESENVFQTFSYSLADVQIANPEFDVTQIQRIQFIFDKSPKGVVLLDNLGFMAISKEM